MICKQIAFMPEGEEAVQGGILCEDSSQSFIICGCCGGIYEPDEVEIIERFEDWIDIEADIRG